MGRAHRRGPWVAEEDATLLALVASRGPNNWVQISQHINFRSPKQCRERYHQNLKSSLNHDPISAQEGELIEQMVSDMGKKWAEIARRLGNRSDNAVKNWWNGSQNRRKRNVPHNAPSSKTLSSRTQPLSAVRSSKSPVEYDVRHRNYGNPSPRCTPSWQDRGTSNLERRTLRSQQNQTIDRIYSRGQSHLGLHDAQHFQINTYHPQRTPERFSGPVLRTYADDHNAQSLPSLRLINTSQPSPSRVSHVMEPPLSATSMERAPSLVSDHNSTYSISPKAWSSPRPDVSVPVETNRSRWHDSSHMDRRGSAPTISKFVSMPFTGDEGYASAIPPSASSEPKYLLPTPVSRTVSFDGQYSSSHRYSASNPNICLAPKVEHHNHLQDSSGTRDTRMKFSSLLN
ncbi:hypothetical protein GJ744_003062 [Endocarpon pusillum]|uniref:Myb-like DNA-binding protein myb-1 n=1 Tax=Endocarpon pusillum TaxID=364733 RepID=A0A8H7A743_9EURO|nr:hypothetical protein GJ744_003062 [Endocarpon pusillum]